MTWSNYRFGFEQFGILPEERLEIFLLVQPEPEVLSGVRVLGCILKIVLEAGEVGRQTNELQRDKAGWVIKDFPLCNNCSFRIVEKPYDFRHKLDFFFVFCLKGYSNGVSCVGSFFCVCNFT